MENKVKVILLVEDNHPGKNRCDQRLQSGRQLVRTQGHGL
jgi:hypothetical protein